MEDFEKIIVNTLNSDKLQREYSEAFLKTFLSQRPQELSSLFLSQMQSNDPLVSNQCLVLYRTLFISNPDFQSITANPSLKSQFLSLINPSRPLPYLKKLANILIPLSISQNFESEILSLITCTWLNSSHSILKSLSLYFLEISTEYSTFLTIIKNNSGDFLDLMWNLLHSPEQSIQITACKTVCVILTRIEETNKHLLIFNRVLEIIQGVKSNEIEPVLTEICAFVIDFPNICAKCLDTLTLFLSSLVKGTESDLKKQAGLILIELTNRLEEKDFTIKIIQEILTDAFLLLSEIDFVTDLQAWTQQEYINNESGPADIGKELLIGLSGMTQEQVYTFYNQILEAHLNSNHWLYQHTALVSLGLVSEGFEAKFLDNLEHFTTLLFKFAVNQNPRLRHAAVSSLGLFCTYLSPHIQEKYSAHIMNCLFFNLNLNNPSKVIVISLKAVINFCNELSEENAEVVEKFLPSLIGYYDALFSDNCTSSFVLVEMIESLTIVVATVEDFSLYIQMFLPKLESVFFMQGIDDKLKCVALKCIGCIAQKESCNDSCRILENVIKLKENTDQNHAFYINMMEVIAKCIVKINFLPEYFESLMSEILSNANRSIEFYVGDKSLTPTATSEIQLTAGGCEQKILMDTVAIDNKIAACKILKILIKGLKEKFYPWSNSTFEALLPSTTSLFSSQIKKAASKSLLSLLKNSPLPISESYSLKIFQNFLSILQNHQSTSLNTLNFLLKNMHKVSNAIGGLTILGISGAIYLSQILNSILSSIFSSFMIHSLGIPDSIDPDLQKTLKNFLILLSALLKSFKSEFKPYFLPSFQTLSKFLFSDIEDLVLSSLSLLFNYIESIKETFPDPNNLIIPQLTKLLYHDNEQIRQYSIYALGLTAWHSQPNAFEPYIDCSISACSHLITLPNAFTDYLDSTEYAINTLGKLAIKYRQDLLPLWLQHLPLDSKSEAAEEVHNLFIQHYKLLETIQRAPEVYSRILTY